MKVDRRKIMVLHSKNDSIEEPAKISKSDALSFMWELTEEVFSLSGRYNVKSRLQRDVISITRKRS